jgi:methyltransferase-like protein/cyclopropane fatty-acyl-phospholipid synthase-like methyltransferase
MSDTLQASYDDVPYLSEPRYATHPDCLAAVATLFGMRPAPPGRCRVLELGCSTGGNLLAMAEALPDSRFVGIDLSPRQVAEAQAVARAVGLCNVDLRAQSILDFDGALGEFDYIVCEGVYSWVPEAVREKILAVCRRHLAPQGVAYVSYNVYPGWHQRGMVREMLQFHARGFADARERVRQARAFLDFLVRSVPNPDATYARLLREEADQLAPAADHYLFHEHLEEVNHPVYFHQFAERAAAHGLQYLEDAWWHARLAGVPPEVEAALGRWSADPLRQEQYLDFLYNRTFRQSLLCHDRLAPERRPSADRVPAFRVTTRARPVSARPEVSSTAAEEFRTDKGREITTNIPLVKAALVALFEAWPRSLAFDDLVAASRQRLGPGAAGDDAAGVLAEALLQLYLASLVALHVRAPEFVLEPGERPLASPLARHQAATGTRVTSRLHAHMEVQGLDREVLRCLDGTRDRAAVLDALVEAVVSGRVELRQDGRLLRDAREVRALLAQAVGPCLRRLALSALLIG